MTRRHWTYVALILLAGLVLLLSHTSRPSQSPAPPRDKAVTGLSGPFRGASPGQVPGPGDASRGDTAFQPAINVLRADPAREARIATEMPGQRPGVTPRQSMVAGLKRYEDLWLQPTPATLHAAEADILPRLEALPPRELVGLLREGLSTRPLNLVLISLENAMRGPLRAEYEVALTVGMEEAYERPDKLELMADVTLRLEPPLDRAESAARLLMKREPSGRLAELLGGFASRLQGDPRHLVKQFAVERDLVETLVHLVDDGADLARLEAYLADPATRGRTERALRKVRASAMNDDIRQQLQRALER